MTVSVHRPNATPSSSILASEAGETPALQGLSRLSFETRSCRQSGEGETPKQ